ncbi:MAG: arylesterase [Alphaproteobacteria bacterium]|nr:arylesterase [Alphaproteobacteria bacterium]
MGIVASPLRALPPRSYGKLARQVQRLAAAALVLCFAAFPGVFAAAAADKPVRIVALGDSLTAGYQLPAADAFPARLAQALRAKGLAVEIANAGVSGDTSTGGLSRLDWSVPDGTDAVILELGANDVLRGIEPKVTQAALDETIGKLKARGIEVLLCGMLSPPNMGPDYARAFNAIFPALAAKHGVAFYPFFLEGVAANAKLNLADGMHPNAAGVDEIVRRMLPEVEKLVARIRARRGA